MVEYIFIGKKASLDYIIKALTSLPGKVYEDNISKQFDKSLNLESPPAKLIERYVKLSLQHSLSLFSSSNASMLTPEPESSSMPSSDINQSYQTVDEILTLPDFSFSEHVKVAIMFFELKMLEKMPGSDYAQIMVVDLLLQFHMALKTPFRRAR